MIEASLLCKQFKNYRKSPGFWGSLRSLFVRQYEFNKAVRDFNVKIDSGETIGLLGPNGAGKTTLMKMFTGIIVPTSGELRVLGFKPWERNRQFRRKIALVMGQKSQLNWDLPPMDSFLLLQRFYEIGERDFRSRLGQLTELLEVKNLLHIHVRKLSLGERMKMELMACLLHEPDVIFLDEPTIGLDLVAQQNIRRFLRNYHQSRKVTIILTSHYMADVEALCPRLVLILKGCKAFDGSIDEFADILGREKHVSFYFSHPQNDRLDIWRKYDGRWNDSKTRVDLRIPEIELREVSGSILKEFSVVDFQTEKMPIERVMSSLMTNPEIIGPDAL